MANFMSEALIEAKKSLYDFKEVPVGCVFVYENNIIARGHNLVTKTANPTRHAEFVCIDQVLEYSKANNLDYNEVFQKVIVVVSVEPCIMCMTALFNLKVNEIIYGCKNDRFGGSTVINVAQLLNDNSTKITSGVSEDEAMQLLKEFYQGENLAAPISAKEKRRKKEQP